MNIYIEPEEFERVLDLIVALKTKMQEWDKKSIDIKKNSETCNTCKYRNIDMSDFKAPCCSCDGHNLWVSNGEKKEKHTCRDCAYESLRMTDIPCNTCGIEEGNYFNWSERKETE